MSLVPLCVLHNISIIINYSLNGNLSLWYAVQHLENICKIEFSSIIFLDIGQYLI